MTTAPPTDAIDGAIQMLTSLGEFQQAEKLQAQLSVLVADRNKAWELVKEARDEIRDWGDYASPYFQEKWDLAGVLARFDLAISEQEGK